MSLGNVRAIRDDLSSSGGLVTGLIRHVQHFLDTAFEHRSGGRGWIKFESCWEIGQFVLVNFGGLVAELCHLILMPWDF